MQMFLYADAVLGANQKNYMLGFTYSAATVTSEGEGALRPFVLAI